MAKRGRKPGTGTRLTREQEQEAVQLYEEKASSVPELAEMYGMGESNFYRLLARHGVIPHNRRNTNGNGAVKITKIDPATLNQPPLPPEEIEVEEVPVMHTGTTEVVVDKQNLVQTVTRHSARRLHTWEVSYSGTVMVEAEEIEEAIREARKLGVVKRIHSVTEKKE